MLGIGISGGELHQERGHRVNKRVQGHNPNGLAFT